MQSNSHTRYKLLATFLSPQVEAFYKAASRGGKSITNLFKRLAPSNSAKALVAAAGSGGGAGFTLEDLLMFSNVSAAWLARKSLKCEMQRACCQSCFRGSEDQPNNSHTSSRRLLQLVDVGCKVMIVEVGLLCIFRPAAVLSRG